MIQNRLLSFSLVMVGVLLVAHQTGMFTAEAFGDWRFLLLLLGLFAMLLSLYKQNGTAALLSGSFTAIAIFGWGEKHISGWLCHPSTFMFLLGLGILFRCSIEKERRSTLVGCTLLLCGFCAYPNLSQWKGLEQIGPMILNTYWPVLLIALGFLLLKRR
ncbi:hypothetical protein [Pasteuria penetrans]|uniref:hypothetical protein n=1 Tax=Pasteuria penetrans TaxID=86005 RepID=UPI000F9B5932|nr:hypothetical protein [Pasteuria penetrans]